MKIGHLLIMIFCGYLVASEANQLPEKKYPSSKNVSLSEKFRVREILIKNSKSSNLSNDRVENLLNTSDIEKNIERMDNLGLMSSAPLSDPPWSDDYWPIYKGILGNRYMDQTFYRFFNWSDAYGYIDEYWFSDLVQTEGDLIIDTLSPSEKYDLLLGLDQDGLTKKMWDAGKYYYDRSGEVEVWMGICHGWAAASYMLPRPKNKITLKSKTGHPITFYPSDMKALASLLWANASPGVNFIGSRCNSDSPSEDENGRIIDPKCFDTNPATWHLTVVNSLGILKRSFIFDAVYDYEVWNQPAISYQYNYINPISDRQVDNLDEAIVSLDEYEKDPYREHRATNTKFVVGIRMNLSYLVETTPNHSIIDTPLMDQKNEVMYYYDLELDEELNIIGGEWHISAHPDFIWTPTPDARAISRGDYLIYNSNEGWNVNNPVPNSWKRAARKAASSSQPLTHIVEKLIELANKETD